jgi:hypothetical protein
MRCVCFVYSSAAHYVQLGDVFRIHLVLLGSAKHSHLVKNELTRFCILVILSPYLSTAYEQIRALQTCVVTEQTVICHKMVKGI